MIARPSTDPPLIDLVDEHLACDGLSAKAVRWLLKRGVSTAALFVDGQIPMLCADVVFTRARFEFARYRPSEEAVSAFIFPVYDRWGDNTDLAAWRPPADVGTWLSNVALIGEEQIDRALRGGLLQVHAGVLDWLRAERRGVVVVDPRRALPTLREVGPLVVDDVEFGEQLKRKLTLKAPRIMVRAAATDRVAA